MIYGISYIFVFIIAAYIYGSAPIVVSIILVPRGPKQPGLQ